MTSSIAVATVLTVYGIETTIKSFVFFRLFKLQQYLPFTVLKLKPKKRTEEVITTAAVATVLTVYGIETY